MINQNESERPLGAQILDLRISDRENHRNVADQICRVSHGQAGIGGACHWLSARLQSCLALIAPANCSRSAPDTRLLVKTTHCSGKLTILVFHLLNAVALKGLQVDLSFDRMSIWRMIWYSLVIPAGIAKSRPHAGKPLPVRICIAVLALQLLDGRLLCLAQEIWLWMALQTKTYRLSNMGSLFPQHRPF